MRRLRAQNDDLTKQNQDLNGVRARLTQENFELHRQVQDLDASTAALSKAKSLLQVQLDDAKNRLDDESRVGSHYAEQYSPDPKGESSICCWPR